MSTCSSTLAVNSKWSSDSIDFCWLTYWAGLEKSWNGYLLSTVDAVIKRAGNFYWKGMRTMACLVDAIYAKGVKLGDAEKRDLEHRLERSEELSWWDITIQPKTVLL